MNKKALELSITFIVLLIISITIFAGSLFFLQKFYKTATETREAIDRQTEAEIRALLRGGSPVAIPLAKQKIKSI